MLNSLIPRSEFPLLDRPIGREGQKAVYLDSAASSLVPDQVLAAVERYYHTSCSNIHRGAHRLAEESTDAFERAREETAAFLDIADPEQVIFTHGCTESLNMAARCWAVHRLQPGDVIAIAEENHHANIVPWQMVAREYGFDLKWIPVTPEGRLDYGAWCGILELEPKMVALTHCSNVLGYTQPDLSNIIDDARQVGAKVVLDAAQTAGHTPLSFPELSADFLAFSPHKMMGLTGLGVLACSLEVLDEMVPCYGGGGMIERVDREGFLAASAPQAFEAGTPPIVAAVAFSAVLSMIEGIGLTSLERHTNALCKMAVEGLSGIPGIRLLGDPQQQRGSLVSFAVEGIHPHDVSQMLSDRGIALRAGHHCAMPLHRAMGMPASLRASVAGYSDESDIKTLIATLTRLVEKGA